MIRFYKLIVHDYTDDTLRICKAGVLIRLMFDTRGRNGTQKDLQHATAYKKQADTARFAIGYKKEIITDVKTAAYTQAFPPRACFQTESLRPLEILFAWRE